MAVYRTGYFRGEYEMGGEDICFCYSEFSGEFCIAKDSPLLTDRDYDSYTKTKYMFLSPENTWGSYGDCTKFSSRAVLLAWAFSWGCKTKTDTTIPYDEIDQEE